MGITPENKLGAGRFIALKKLPYFASLIYGLVPHRVPDGTLNTMGVTEKGVLLWDAKDIEALTPAQIATSYLHEGLHVLNLHGLRRGTRDPKLWNAAADLAINSDLEAAGCDMLQNVEGKKMLLPKAFDLPSGKTAEWYYSALEQKAPQQGKPQCGSGHCGSGAGHKQQAEDNVPQPKSASDATGSSTNQKPGDAEAPEGRSASEIEAIKQQVALAVQEHKEKRRGTVPGSWLAWADAIIAPPKVRWQDHLAKKARGALAEVAGMTHTTYNKPSRRQGGVGFGLGMPVMHAFVARLPKVMVAIDTSGSMACDNAIGQAMGEVQGILKTLNAPITFVSCDAMVQATGLTAQWRDVFKNLKGGGGTSFRPVFEHIADMPAKQRPTLLIYATDGEGDCPEEMPAALRGVKTIWLLCGRHARSQPWGLNLRVE